MVIPPELLMTMFDHLMVIPPELLMTMFDHLMVIPPEVIDQETVAQRGVKYALEPSPTTEVSQLTFISNCWIHVCCGSRAKSCTRQRSDHVVLHVRAHGDCPHGSRSIRAQTSSQCFAVHCVGGLAAWLTDRSSHKDAGRRV